MNVISRVEMYSVVGVVVTIVLYGRDSCQSLK